MTEFKVGERVIDCKGDIGTISKVTSTHLDVNYDTLGCIKNMIIEGYFLEDSFEDVRGYIIDVEGDYKEHYLNANMIKEKEEKEKDECRDGAILALFTSKELLDELNRRMIK